MTLYDILHCSSKLQFFILNQCFVRKGELNFSHITFQYKCEYYQFHFVVAVLIINHYYILRDCSFVK